MPPEVMNEYRNVHLDIDIMFVNGIPFLTAISRDLRLIHSSVLKRRTNTQIKKVLTNIKSTYEKRGFSVKTIHGDNEFENLKQWAEDEKMSLETCDTNAHVPTIKRTNRFLN